MNKKIGSGKQLARKLTFLSRKAGEDTTRHVQENVIDRFAHIRQVRLLILEWSLLVLAIVFLSLTQAYWYSESYATDTYKEGGTYIEGTLGEIDTLNPLFSDSGSEKTLSRLMFLGLSMPDYSGHSGLGLAKSITTDNSGKIWTVKLRDGLKWSDGEELTNEDVLFTADLIKNPLLNSGYSSNLSGVKVEENENKEIIFTLSTANAYFESALDFPILPKHILDGVAPELILEHNFSSKPVGSGAFSYNATQTIGNMGEKAIYLTANKNYYEGRPLIDSFVVHAFTKSSDIVAALNNGTITASGALSGDETTQVNSANLSEKQSALNYGVFAFLNTEQLSDKTFRQALRQGINMEKVRSVLNGEHALDFPITNTQMDLENAPELPILDTNTAKKTIKKYLDNDSELKKAGLNIVTVRSGYLPEVSEKLAEEIRSLGVQATVTAYDSNQDFLFNVLTQRAYDILVYEIGFGADPDLFAYFHSTEANGNGHNLSSYRNSIVSDLVLSARSTMNETLRARKYENFLKYFVDDVPAIGIYQTNLNYFVNKNVRSFSSENKLVTPLERFIDVKRWGIEPTSKNRTP